MHNCNKKVVGCPGISDNLALTSITNKLSEIKQTNSNINITSGNLHGILICNIFFN